MLVASKYQKNNKMNCSKINQIPFSQILDNFGMKPVKQTNKESWFLSPFREEKLASFKVNLASNRFHDFGNGAKGTVVDFWCRYKSCNVKTAIKEISNIFSFPKQVIITKQISRKADLKESAPQLKIIEVKPLSINILKDYLSQRGLSNRVYSYINEVHFEINGRKNFSIGFMNDNGGYELRNKLFKGCSSKTITTLIKKGSTTLCVFEGFIDYLSYLERTIENENPVVRDFFMEINESFLILNSLAIVQKAKPYFSQFEKIDLYLDNDRAGQRLTDEILSEYSNINDCSKTYNQLKDYNDFHIKSKETSENFLKEVKSIRL